MQYPTTSQVPASRQFYPHIGHRRLSAQELEVVAGVDAALKMAEMYEQQEDIMDQLHALKEKLQSPANKPSTEEVIASIDGILARHFRQ